MKMTRFSEPQIRAILRQAEGGVPVAELCREHGITESATPVQMTYIRGLTTGSK
jgi:putative transposase